MNHSFEDALGAVFEDRTSDLSDRVRGLLRELWNEGVKLGLYVEREQLEVPSGVFEKRPPRRPPSGDPRREPGKLVQLREEKEKVIEKAEELAVQLEHRVDYEPTLGLGGDELAKARHRYLQQVGHVERALDELLAYVQKFKIYSY